MCSSCKGVAEMIRRSTNKVILTCLLLLGLWPSTADSGLPPQRERNVIWRDPGDVRRLDLAVGPGGRAGAPAPPFNFVGESDSGTNPKIEVRDARGVIWGVKWGE